MRAGADEVEQNGESAASPDAAAGVASAEATAHVLVGRDVELDALLGLLGGGEPAVINVTGSRGAGKSTLVQAALERLGSSAEIVRLDLTGETTATALAGLRRHLSRVPVPVQRGVLASVADPPLLYLERGDVLAQGAGELVELATSNGALVVVESVPELRDRRIAVVRVGPLSPEAAVELFRGRAEATGRMLDEGELTAAHIRRICAAVDANPLAIELAAARLPFLPLASLLAAVEAPERALAVLCAPHPAASNGRVLRAGLAESHRSTSPASQRLLDLLSVFSGSFTMEAVEAIWAGNPAECYDALSELVDLRLVHFDEATASGRCRLSRLVRGFATERIAGSELEEQARLRHAEHYCTIARRAALAHDDADEDTAHVILGEDYPEALAALRWLTERDPARALRLAADLGWEAHRRGGGAALVATLEALTQVEYAGAEPARRDALLWLARLASWSPLGADRAERIGRQLTDALTLARRLAQPVPLLHALRVQFFAIAAHGDLDAATAACREGIELATMIGHPRWVGRFEVSLAAIQALRHEYDTAVPLATSGLARAIRAGDRRGIALGSLALHAMPPEQVPSRAELPSLEEVLEIFRTHGDLQNELHTLATLAQEAIDREDPRTAAQWVLARVNRLGRTDLLNGLTVSVMLAVHISRLRAEHTTSARLHGTVAAHMQPLLAILAPRHVDLYRSGLTTLREALGRQDFDDAVAAGRLLDREQTLAELVNYLRTVATDPTSTTTQTPAAPSPPTITETTTGNSTPAGPAHAQRAGLSPREDQVLRLLAQGLRNKDIAAELGVSPKSVMHHTCSIYRKLGVRGRLEAVTTAAHQGLLPAD